MSLRVSKERRTNHVLRQVIDALICAQEHRDPYTYLHARRTAELAVAIGSRLGLPAAALRRLRLAGLVHDIGKIAIPAEILDKPGPLTAQEFAIMQTHCEIGRDILMKLRSGRRVAEIVHQHHEKLDGSGYPRGLTGASIPLESRIMAVADCCDALSSARPYRPAWEPERVAAELQRLVAAHKLDDDAVAACLEILLRPRPQRRASSGHRTDCAMAQQA